MNTVMETNPLRSNLCTITDFFFGEGTAMDVRTRFLATQKPTHRRTSLPTSRSIPFYLKVVQAEFEHRIKCA